MWGKSPPLNFHQEMENLKDPKEDFTNLEFLTVGAVDGRHIIKTLASSYLHPNHIINFHVIESSLEHVARSILLLNICLQKDLGLQETSHYYLDILGNTLVTPGTAKYLMQIIHRLIDVVTRTIPCSWLDLESLKYKDRDIIEAVFKFWARAVCEGLPIVQYWDRRLRQALGTRYDYRDGVFDWDYHMVLKDRNIAHLTLQEYKFWRRNGIAFTWLETEPARCNPTLINNIIPHGNGFIHYAYLGDITNGPFWTWSQDEADKNQSNLRATDNAERKIIKSLYQIRRKEQCPDEIIAAHRDKSVLNGTLVTEMPDTEIEQESWILHNKTNKKSDDQCPWIDITNFKVTFHTTTSCEKYQNKNEWKEVVDAIFVANNMIHQLPYIVPLMTSSGVLIVESRKFIVDVRKEGQTEFAEELLKISGDLGLKYLEPFNPHQDNFARLIKDNKTNIEK